MEPYRFGHGPTSPEPPIVGYSRAATMGLVAVVLLGVSLGSRWVAYAITFVEVGVRLDGIVPRWVPPTLATLTGVSSYARLAGVVAFCVWIYRAVKNTRIVGRPMTITPGWAVAWVLIPIANVYMTYRTMNELVKSSDPRAMVVSRPTVLTWWVLAVGGNVLRFIAPRLWTSSVVASMRLEVVATLALSGSVVALGWLILGIHRGQEAWKQRAQQP